MAAKKPGQYVDARTQLGTGETAPDRMDAKTRQTIRQQQAKMSQAQIQKRLAYLADPANAGKVENAQGRLAMLQSRAIRNALGGLPDYQREMFNRLRQARDTLKAGEKLSPELQKLQARAAEIKKGRQQDYMNATGRNVYQTGYKPAATPDAAATTGDTAAATSGEKPTNSKFLDPATAAKLRASGVKRKSYILAQLQNEMSPMGQLKGQIGNAVAGMRPPRPRPQRPRPLPGGRQLLGPFPAPQRPVPRPQRPRPFPNPGPFKPTPR